MQYLQNVYIFLHDYGKSTVFQRSVTPAGPWFLPRKCPAPGKLKAGLKVIFIYIHLQSEPLSARAYQQFSAVQALKFLPFIEFIVTGIIRIDINALRAFCPEIAS